MFHASIIVSTEWVLEKDYSPIFYFLGGTLKLLILSEEFMLQNINFYSIFHIFIVQHINRFFKSRNVIINGNYDKY